MSTRKAKASGTKRNNSVLGLLSAVVEPSGLKDSLRRTRAQVARMRVEMRAERQFVPRVVMHRFQAKHEKPSLERHSNLAEHQFLV